MQSDFLAVCLIGAGSAWGRAPDLDTAVKRCTEALIMDWGSVYKLDGVEVTINLYEVTGNDSVWWDHQGMHADKEAEHPITKLGLREVTLSDKRRRRA